MAFREVSVDKVRNLLAVLASVGASLPWWWILPAALSLLGVAGSAWAAVAVGWLSPVLIVLSIGLLARSFYVLYVLKRGTTPVKVLTWLSATFVVCFWTWWFFLKPLL